MIGAMLYAVSYFLFSNIGTYIFIALLAFFGIMSIGHFSYGNLFSKIGDGIKICFKWIKELFIKAKNTLQKNIQFDSKEKTQEKVKTDKIKKSDSKSKEEVSKEEEKIGRTSCRERA